MTAHEYLNATDYIHFQVLEKDSKKTGLEIKEIIKKRKECRKLIRADLKTQKEQSMI